MACSPLAEGDVTVIVSPVSSHHAGEKHSKDSDATHDSARGLSPVIGVALELPGPGTHEELSTGSQATTQGPGSHASPKKWESPLQVSNLHSLASSTWGNWSKSTSSNVTAPFLTGAETENTALANDIERMPAWIDDHVADAQRESATARPLEANLSAVFNGSAYADVRTPTEFRVLRALPVVQTTIDNTALEAAAIGAATATTLTNWHSVPRRASRSCASRATASKALPSLADSSRGGDVDVKPHTQTLATLGDLSPRAVSKSLVSAKRSSLSIHRRRYGENPLSPSEAVCISPLTFSIPENNGCNEVLADSSASLLAHSVSGTSLKRRSLGSPLQLDINLFSNLSSGADRDIHDGTSRRIHKNVVSILKVGSSGVLGRSMASSVVPELVSTFGRSTKPPPPPQQQQQQQPCPSTASVKHPGDADTRTTMWSKCGVGAVPRRRGEEDATMVEKTVVPAVDKNPSHLLGTCPSMPQRHSMQGGALRFHSVLRRDEGHKRPSCALPPRSSSVSSADTEEEGSGVSSKTTAANRSIMGHGKKQGAEARALTTLRQTSTGSAAADDACSRKDTFTTAPSRRNHNQSVSMAGTENIFEVPSGSDIRASLWPVLQLPHTNPVGNPSLSNITGQTPQSVASRMQRSVFEAGMRRIHSDVCFGTFISVVNSTRSSFDDDQPPSYLRDKLNEGSASPDTLVAFSGTAMVLSAHAASPTDSKTRMRSERSNSGSNTLGQHHRKRESRCRGWPNSSAAPRGRRANRDDDAASENDRCNFSISSHGTPSSRTSILSFAFGG
ncbi:hypothetical protein JKF63_05971 [Porcisia hertigi]|uniref:Uncharacterized protein n=1 Tax=Porcisia hertigi TaxID=2761500 RepID=A0A836LIC0_9TRYP|nr:hypothetical protein JKF63_05971 [Porcisia hertigi]